MPCSLNLSNYLANPKTEIQMTKPGLASGLVVGFANFFSLPNGLLITDLLQAFVAYAHFLFKHLQGGSFVKIAILFFFPTHHRSVGDVTIEPRGVTVT